MKRENIDQYEMKINALHIGGNKWRGEEEREGNKNKQTQEKRETGREAGNKGKKKRQQ